MQLQLQQLKDEDATGVKMAADAGELQTTTANVEPVYAKPRKP
jgi:hypothetical protein